MRTAILVSREGSIDWLCLPRVDSAAVFAALLGTEENGRWLMAPHEGEVIERFYEPGTFVLVTRWRTPTGEAESREFMPPTTERADLVRQVRCTSGHVRVDHELRLRPEYDTVLPWVRRIKDGSGDHLWAIAGPDAYTLRGPNLEPADHRHCGSFDLTEGRSHAWVLTWTPSHLQAPDALDIPLALERTRSYWHEWNSQITATGRWCRPCVARCLCCGP